MLVVAKIRLADARAELRISQDDLARAARISKPTVTNAERGLRIQRISAHAILKALNAFRQDAGMPPLTIADIEWKIKGE